MSTPICPVHKVAMRESNKGTGFYCPKKDGDVWCKERAKSPDGAAPQVAPLAPTNGYDVLAAAALQFAGNLCRGAGPEMADDAIAIAIKAVSAMKAVS